MNKLWQSCWSGYAAAAVAPVPPEVAAQPPGAGPSQPPPPPPPPLPPRPPLAAPAAPSAPAPPPHPPPPPTAPLSLEQWAAVLAALAPPAGGAPARAVPPFEASMFKTADVRGLLALHGCAPPKAATKMVR